MAAAMIRMHLLAVPLERDEGEYAYAGQLILQGIAPYAQAYNMKMPGIYAAYALVMAVFGETITGIHMGLLLVNAATTLLLFLLCRSLYGAFAGITAAASFALLSMGQPVQGIFANAEHFVILPAIGGILLLVRSIESGRRSTLLIGAVLLGLAFIMKQHGVAFIAFGGLYLFLKKVKHKPLQVNSLLIDGLVYLAGVILPFALTCMILWQAGVFDRFWFWTFDYASQYVSSVPFSIGMGNLKTKLATIASASVSIWIMAAIGLSALIWNRKPRRNALFTVLFCTFSFLAVFPGFYFRSHYFILLLPAVALLAGIGGGSISDIIARTKTPAIKPIPTLLVLAVLFYAGWQQREFLFYMGPNEASRAIYGLNPFPESLEVARFLRDNSNDSDRIAVIGSEPQIYFYSKRQSASGHIYTYALMESHPYALPMQKEMINEIESVKPRYLIFVNISTSWMVRENSEQLIFRWFNDYSKKHYELVGIVEMDNNGTKYLWNEDSRGYQIKSPIFLSVFRMKD